MLEYLLSTESKYLISAESYFDKVLVWYEDGNHKLMEIIAQSYGEKGLIYYYFGDLEESRVYYQNALDLSSLPSRKFLFNKKICEIYFLQERYDESIDCYSTLHLRYPNLGIDGE